MSNNNADQNLHKGTVCEEGREQCVPKEGNSVCRENLCTQPMSNRSETAQSFTWGVSDELAAQGPLQASCLSPEPASFVSPSSSASVAFPFNQGLKGARKYSHEREVFFVICLKSLIHSTVKAELGLPKHFFKNSDLIL